MRRVKRSVPWKEQARAGLAPDVTVRKCQKGGFRPPFFSTPSPSSQSSFAPLSFSGLSSSKRSSMRPPSGIARAAHRRFVVQAVLLNGIA